MARVALFAAVLCAPLVAPTTAEAGGAVVASVGEQVPGVSVRMAVAIGPASTTRWSEITLPAGPALGWLVPVRPGAAIEWASNAWFPSLETASAPRVLVPDYRAPCELHQSIEIPPAWVTPGPRLSPSGIALPASAGEVETWAESHGLSVSAAEMKRIDDLYASGWRVAATPLGASAARRSSPTLRVTDDGGPILPLSIGGAGGDTAVTLFVVGEGKAELAGTRALDESLLTWGARGSTYAALRKQLLGSEGWLLESASHAALFEEVAGLPPVLGIEAASIPPVVATYFVDPDCATDVARQGRQTEPQAAASLACGGRTDFAVALAGIAPANAVLTRFAGVLPTGTPAIALGPGADRSPFRRASTYDHPCPAGVDVDPSGSDPSSSTSTGTGIRPPSPSAPSGGSSTSSSSYEDTEVYVPSDGCGSGTTVVTGDDDDDTTSDGWDTSDSSSDACSGDTSSSSDSTSDGWDDSDSNDDCSGDTSSSTDSSSDGWDDKDSSCTVTRHRKRRGPSPLSRVIMVAVALLIPLRRLSRRRSGGYDA